MSRAREKMRPWLVRQIDSRAVSGLSWMDKERTIFSVPWKHAAGHGWEMDKDAGIFQKWAIHTGKYVVGQECSPKTWKANFRCALRSLPDVVEVKDWRIQKGHKAVRVFRMLPEARKPAGRRPKQRKPKMRRKIKIEKPDSDHEESSNCPFERAPTEDSTVTSSGDSEQELKIDFDVPEFSQMVEVREEYDFQVSPEHSPVANSSDYDDNVTVMICRPLEKDAHWSSFDETGKPAKELSTSPGSQWSETSGEEIEEPLYTTLTPSPSPFMEVWSPSLPHTLFSFHDDSPSL